MNSNASFVSLPTYSKVAELIGTHFSKLAKALVLFSVVYVVLFAAITALAGVLWFSIERFVQGNMPVTIGLGALCALAHMTAIAVLWSALSSSVLKIYRREDKASTVDNRVFIRMFLLLLLILFLNTAATIACAGITSTVAGLVENKELVASLGSFCIFGLSGLLSLSFLFAPFLLVDGANLSDAINGSFNLVAKNFIWLVPLLVFAAVTNFLFGFGFAILGAVYFLSRSPIEPTVEGPRLTLAAGDALSS